MAGQSRCRGQSKRSPASAAAKTPPLITRGQIKFLTQNLDYSIAKAKRVLGYRPRVDFRDGIVAALDHLTGKKTCGHDPTVAAIA